MANCIGLMDLLGYGQMAHNDGIWTINGIEPRVLLLFGQMALKNGM